MSLQISFRSKKYPILLSSFDPSATVLDLKTELIQLSSSSDLSAPHLKLLHSGKILSDASLLTSSFPTTPSSATNPIKVIAMGMSAAEQEANKAAAEEMKLATRRDVKDDLSKEGRLNLAKSLLSSSSSSNHRQHSSQSPSPFLKLEVLPMLPFRQAALSILESLSSDPGIQSCLRSRGWTVGVLNELYPSGQVGVSDVCVLGLNTNKGACISLRLRTDDLKGFRHLQSIRKVLFHELAHNDISEHNDEFFRLMRDVERECGDMDWRNGDGHSTGGGGGGGGGVGGLGSTASLLKTLGPELESLQSSSSSRTFVGGSGTLGGASRDRARVEAPGVMAGRAAAGRLSEEERGVMEGCGCGRVLVGGGGGGGEGVVATTTEKTMREGERLKLEAGESVEYRAGEGLWVEAKVLKVHLDDGPEKPYYTIEYWREGERAEKQTTRERLKRR